MKTLPLNDADVQEIRKKLRLWYRKKQRLLPWRSTDDPYAIWVSEVMLQQTQVNTVIPYYHRFLNKFPTLRHLASAHEQEVLKLWEGLGYYSRARNLHQAANSVIEEFAGKIPTEKKEFLHLKGVGEYIASAVLSIAFGQPHAVVDGNVKRVLSRLFLIEAPVNQSGSLKQFKPFADRLLDPKHPGISNQAVMELGALTCRPANPVCSECPLQMHCIALRRQLVDVYPKRIVKGAVPEYHVAVGVVFRQKRVLITRRPSKGLLGGLWEFPGGKVMAGESARQACIREIKEEVNLDVVVDAYITRVRHAYTHFKVMMDVFRCSYLSGNIRLKNATGFRWIDLEDLSKYPFPKANHKFMHLF